MQLSNSILAYQIPKIANGPANADTFNTPLLYIEDALNDLSGKIQSNVNKQAVFQWQAPVAADVSAGDLVYWDTSAGVFKKALASTYIDPSTGKRIRAQSSLVQGLILSVSNTGNSAVLLKYGYYVSGSIIQAVLGVGAITTDKGLYYLSSSDSGTATLYPQGNLKVPCLNYYGNGAFSVLPVDLGVQIFESDSIVRDIQSQTLQINKQLNGVIQIEIPEKSQEYIGRTPRVVADISNSTIYYTDVVSNLLGGPGIDVQQISNSGWRISSAIEGHYLPAQDVFLNGTQLSSDGIYTSIVFPGKAAAPKVVIQKWLPYYSSEKTFTGDLQVWAYCNDGSGQCSINIKWISFSTGIQTDLTSSDSDIGDCSMNMSHSLCISSAINNVTLSSQGMLVAVISGPGDGSNTTVPDIYCNKFGFYLTRSTNSGASDASLSSID